MSYLLINLDTSIPQTGPHLLFGLFEFVEFDAVPESTNRRAAEITMHPVEEGADVTDHVRALPRELDLVGVASNVPASFLDWAARSSGYAQDVYDQLNEWMDSGRLLTVLAVGDFYESMAIVSMDRGHDNTKGKSVHVSLSLREVQVVSTETVDAPTPKTARGAKTKPKGQKATKTDAQDNTTIFKDIISAGRS